MITALRAAAVAVLVVLATTATATAGPPGKWSKVTGPDPNTLEIGVARTDDGALHVLWVLDDNPQDAQSRVVNSQISADAKTVSGPSHVLAYPDGANNRVALIPVPGGLRAFFAGLYPNDPLDKGLASATSADGMSWSGVAPASDGATGSKAPVYVAAGIGATLAGGTVFSAWGDSAPGAAGYHVGLSPGDADVHFGGAAATVDGPNTAVDSVSGQVVLAWNDLDADRVLVQPLSPAGGRMNTPGGQAPDLLERVAVTGRLGAGGIYVAYLQGTNPFTSRPVVWRVGASAAMVLSKTKGARFMGVAPAPDGRLWAFWVDGRWELHATRSNKAATKFGAVVDVALPSGTDTVYSLEGEGSQGPLDVLALAERSPTDLANWHQRVLPGLTLTAKGGTGKASLAVTDAGEPVKGATVKLGSKSKVTPSSGKVTISAAAGLYTATAKMTGYTQAKRKVRVK